ncbi:MAG: sigma 54-interacting transcriptional regulator, partial [Deltaproteobacteria bacterium]|nr:sigma 54-interacting transcriptional regulator [Deltaproteobacteria bacterium]
MAVARFVVLEGPDSGREFPIPLRGGGIGRGEGNVVQLSDLSVSRIHCTVELRDGQLALVDSESRNRTLVNGKPITTHVLEQGDEVVMGQTRLAFVPSEGSSASLSVGTPVRATMEIGSRVLLAAAKSGSTDAEGRAHRYLGALAALGDSLAKAEDRQAVLHSSCAASRDALEAERTIINMRSAGGRLTPVAAAANGPADLEVPQSVLGMVLGEGKSIAFDDLELAGGKRAVAVAPLWSSDNTPNGLLWAERNLSRPWDRTDVMAIGCLAHLISAAVGAAEAQQVLAQENRELVAQIGGREFIGESNEAAMVMGFVAKVGPSDATVLLTGESGSGKEMVARAIHDASRRSKKSFVAVNCAALTESLIESELFGHEKGAFTGANERKLGRFELANDGTLFLDEVGELPLGCQTKFLRVLEEQTFERVGGGKPIVVDVRVVAATNRNLGEMVRRGEFREDLYYRLSVIHTQVPPLRRRKGDIPALCEHFLSKLSRQVARRIVGFSPDAMEMLVAYPWPGNVRELKNAVERAIVLGDGQHIQVADLPPNIVAGVAGPAGPASGPPVPGSGSPPYPR